MIDPHDSVIVRTMSRILIPLIQIFALYVLFFGQYGPGGGFVGGVMLGTSLILGILVYGPKGEPCIAATKLTHGDGIGLIIFAGVGGLCLILGGQFLNYSSLEFPWVDNEARKRYLGILMTQIGVAVDIAVTAISIVFSLSLINETEQSHE